MLPPSLPHSLPHSLTHSLTSIILTFDTHTSTSNIIAAGGRIHCLIVVTATSMIVTITQLARECIARGPIAPWLVVVKRKTALTVWPLRVVYALTSGVDLRTTATRVAIAGTPVVT